VRRAVSDVGKRLARLASELGSLSGAFSALEIAVDECSKGRSVSIGNATTASTVTVDNTTNGARSDRVRLDVKYDGDLSKAARKLLVAIAQKGGRATDNQISIMSGYRLTSSTFANALSELRVAGLMDGPPDARELTHAGRAAAANVPPAPSGRDLLDWWATPGRLEKSERTMLALLFDHGTLSRPELSTLSGYNTTSSTFANAISKLRTLELATGPDGGDLTIAEAFR
jgi:hypothetical protein